MKTWDDLRRRVEQERTPDPHGRSTAKHLYAMIDQAEKWGIDPTDAVKASSSNLREIIREARKAIRVDDKARLQELFRLAVQYTNADLRIYLRGDKRERITVRKAGSESSPTFHFTVSQAQMERIRRCTGRKLVFVEE